MPQPRWVIFPDNVLQYTAHSQVSYQAVGIMAILLITFDINSYLRRIYTIIGITDKNKIHAVVTLCETTRGTAMRIAKVVCIRSSTAE